ncbi:MAG: hypothetical protein WDA00_00465 [Eubacteriales bacterium]
MITFFKANSYDIVRLFVNQIGMTIFGLMLTFAAAVNDPNLTGTFTLLVSLFSIGFYLFLIYAVAWELGAKNKIKIDAGRMKRDPLHGLKLILFAEVPNMLLAFFMLLGATAGLNGMWAVAQSLAGLFEAMYVGVLRHFVTVGDMVGTAIAYTLAIFPATITATVAYIFGLKEYRLLKGAKKPGVK